MLTIHLLYIVEWQTQRNTEPVAVKEPAPAPLPSTTVQSPIIPKTSIITTQTEAYNPPVAMLQVSEINIALLT